MSAPDLTELEWRLHRTRLRNEGVRDVNDSAPYEVVDGVAVALSLLEQLRAAARERDELLKVVEAAQTLVRNAEPYYSGSDNYQYEVRVQDVESLDAALAHSGGSGECPPSECESLRAQLAILQQQLETARRDVRNETLQEVADFCTQAMSYRERLAAETFDATNLEHCMAATELRAIRSAVLATLRLAETGAGEVKP